MVELDREQKKKWHKVGVICAEFIMVASVVAIVVITTLIALGWNVNRDGEIEQTGLLQLHTIPTGATVEIDGETMFARTNMSRSLSPGWHHLKTSREGYDTWEKDIEMTSGWLMRIYYPRLFVQDRKAEKMAELGVGLEFYSVAPDRKHLLWAEPDSTLWQWADVSGDKMDVKEVDVAEVIGATEQVFAGEVVSLQWSKSGEKVLLAMRNGEQTSWYLLNLREISKSRNLSADFGLNFTTIKIMDDAADKLWTLENGNLRLINVSSRELSRILVDGVESFSAAENTVAYLRTKDEVRWAGIYREGEQDATDLYKMSAEPAYVWLSKYYNEDYLAVTQGQKLTIYKGVLPNYDQLEVFAEKELGFVPEQLTGGPGAEYVGAWSGAQVSMLDLDQGNLYKYEAGVGARWLDDSMLYNTTDGKLTVWDFDGTNQRELANGLASYDVMITSSDKYIYYVKAGEKLTLTREQII